MCTQVHLEPKRPRISTYLGESFQLICLIFSEVFWLSKCAELASLIKKWPRRARARRRPTSTDALGSDARVSLSILRNRGSKKKQCGTGLAFPTLNQASFRPADLAPEVRESQPEDPRANLAWGRRWS